MLNADREDEDDSLAPWEVLGGDALSRAAAEAAEAVDGAVGGRETSVSGDDEESDEKEATNVGMATLAGELVF